ncbi:WxL domain-containing protein [Listeria kieliensis]|uniref:WxL domain-containing protein n=1 Tax=Listeria kieliensis TaxID=1621700 RepID=UPI003B83907A
MTLTATSLAAVVGLSLVAIPAYAEEAVKDGGITTSKGDITFEKNKGTTKPKDPDTGKPVIPVDPDPVVPTNGPLSIDYISNVHFGTQKISGSTEVYYATLDQVKDAESGAISERPNMVQITDDRGTNAGWKLTVKQEAQFKNGSSELDGAVLKFENPTLKSSNKSATNTPTAKAMTLSPAGAASDVMIANANQGMGTWFDQFGADQDSGKQSISLTVPGDTAKVEGKYETTLTWTLTDSAV